MNNQRQDPADSEDAREMESKLRDLRAQYDALKAEHPSLTVARAEMVAPPQETVVALLRAERDALKAQVAELEREREALGISRWPVLAPFIVAMVSKLDANKPKKGGREGWSKDDPSTLVRRVIDEAEELEHAVDTQSRGRILAEAADVANMAMMVADASDALNDAPLRDEATKGEKT